MRKASKILLMLGGIFGIIVAVLTLLEGAAAFGIMQLLGLGYTGFGIFDLLVELEVFDFGFKIFGSIEPAILYIVEGVLSFVLSFIVIVAMIVVFVMQLIAGIIALKAKSKQKKGLYIASFVFAGLILFIFSAGWMSWITEILIIVGCILGLIANKKEAQADQEEQPQVVEEVK